MYNSVKEVDSQLQLLVAAGAVNRDRAEEAPQFFDQVLAMTWQPLHPPIDRSR
jgi:hypothetical protein